MCNKIIAFCLLSGVLMAGCATSKTGDATVENVEQVAATKDPKTGKVTTKDGRVLVCKKENPTGSNIPRNICRWEKEKEARMKRDQEQVRDILRKTNVISESGG